MFEEGSWSAAAVEVATRTDERTGRKEEEKVEGEGRVSWGSGRGGGGEVEG